MNRRQFLQYATSSFCGSVFYGRFWEPRWIEVSNTVVPLSRRQGKKVKLVHLSDLHYDNEPRLEQIKNAVRLCAKQEPDAICLTGDYVTGKLPNREKYRLLFKELSEKAPTFACLGNHDGGKSNRHYETSMFRSLLEESGICCLHNQARVLTFNGAQIVIAGVGDLWSGEMDPKKAFSDSKEWQTLPTVLLSHNPDTKDTLRNYPWHLMLCGHTHGGQVLVPFIEYPASVPIYDREFTAGLYPWGKRYIYVTRGIASVLNFRFNCRPEVSVLELLV